MAVVNVEDVKGDALLEIETEGGAYNSLKIVTCHSRSIAGVV